MFYNLYFDFSICINDLCYIFIGIILFKCCPVSRIEAEFQKVYLKDKKKFYHKGYKTQKTIQKLLAVEKCLMNIWDSRENLSKGAVSNASGHSQHWNSSAH